MERPDRKAVSERMNREVELQKGGQMRRGSRKQGRNACVCVGMRQVHSELRMSASYWESWDWSCMLNRYKRREEILDLGVKAFRNLARECTRGRPERLYQSIVRYMKDHEGVGQRDRRSHRALRIPIRGTACN